RSLLRLEGRRGLRACRRARTIAKPLDVLSGPELNSMFSKPVKEHLSTDEGEVDDLAVISMDSKGIDIRVQQGAQVQLSEKGAGALTTLAK
ncbi:hypothetical protein ACJX0J_028885, partial [Zea mays]